MRYYTIYDCNGIHVAYINLIFSRLILDKIFPCYNNQTLR